MPFDAPVLAAVPAVLNFAVKGAQTTYELQSVPEETRALFETIASTKSDILKAREKRLLLAKTCELEDLADWDRAVSDTEAALINLERLVEPARLDICHNKGRIRAKTRLLWVLRDSKSLSATSDRLNLAHQRMLYAMLSTHIGRLQERSDQDNAPPPYVTDKNTIKKAADELGKGDDARTALANSLRIVRNERAIVRPASPAQTTAESSMSTRERGFEDMYHRHEHTLAPPQVRTNSVPEPAANDRLTTTPHEIPFSPRRDMTPLSPRPTRRPVPSASLPNLIPTSALPRTPTRPRPQTVAILPAPPRSPSLSLPPSPPRSPSPFQEEARQASREVAELEAIPVSPERASPSASPSHPERLHREFAQKVNFRKPSQPQRPDIPPPPPQPRSTPHPRPRPRPPYPTTNPPTPEPAYTTPYTSPVQTRHPRTPSPTPSEDHERFKHNPYWPQRDRSPQRSSPNSSDQVTNLDRQQGPCAPGSTIPSSLKPKHPPSSYRPPPPPPPPPRQPQPDIDTGRVTGTSTGAPRSTMSTTSLGLNINPTKPDPDAPTTTSGVKTTPHIFAGHKKPINIRWQPETDGPDKENDMPLQSKGYPFSPALVGKDERDESGQQQSQTYTYMPYRPV